ncbi:MAG: toprim domain-containing protein [Candidatus Pacebacteria bacterium]|nr:toprim domain-containing protein [Candidatus Paceibacterota bacterium]
MADFIETLTQYFAQFPGIGKRQARRMVYYLLRKNKTYTDGLIHQLEHLHDQLGLCSESYQFFYKEHPDETKAPIARNPDRDRTTIMIVEKDMDIEAMEMSRAYHGTYFVLGGLFPALETKYNPVRTDELIREITRAPPKRHWVKLFLLCR